MASVIVADDNGNGHVFPYAEAVGEACRQNGWEHVALVPKSVSAGRLRAGWRPVLPGPAARSRWRAFREFRRVFLEEIARLQSRAGQVLLFVDPTTVTTLAALWSALGALPGGVRVCLMYRYDSSTTRGELPAYRWLNRGLARRLGEGGFFTVTDSEPLREFLAATFRREVSVLPIPHTFPATAGKAAGGSTRCWWPGKPLENKGRAILQELASNAAPKASEFTLVAARSAGWRAVQGGPAVELLPDRLTATEYEEQMHEARVILLPYAPSVYRRRTSGIFVEAVVAGKMPVVSAETWAGSELARHGLPELAWSDWNPETTFVRLATLLANDDLRRRLDALRSRYAVEHSVAGYAAALGTLFQVETSSAR